MRVLVTDCISLEFMVQIFLSIMAVLLALGFAAYLLVRQRNHASMGLVGALLVCSMVEIFDLMPLTHPEKLLWWKNVVLFFESLLPCFWLFYSLTFCREREPGKFSLLLWGMLTASLIFPWITFNYSAGMLFYSPDFAEEKILFLSSLGYFYFVWMMVALVLCMVFLERTLVSLTRSDRWGVKFEFLGAGLILAVLVIYYSQAILHRSIDMNLQPVRSLSLAVGVCLMAFSWIRRGSGRRIRVSRQVAFRSVVVFVVGCYLIIIGLMGAGMRYLGTASQRPLLTALAVLGGIALLIFFLSEKSRRRIRVLLSKHFYQQKYDYRQEWLQFTQALSGATSRQDLERAILAAYASTFSISGATLFLRDVGRREYFCSTSYEMSASLTPLPENHPVVQRLSESEWVIDLYEPGDLFATLELFRSWGFALLVPLLNEARLEGFIALGRRIDDHERLSYEDYDLMKVLGRQATASILTLHLQTQLATAQEMAALGKVSAFVMHDLKNLVSGLAMVVDNAKVYLDEPEFQTDMLETLDVTVAKMKDLIFRLKNMEEKAELDLVPADLRAVAQMSLRMAGMEELGVVGAPVCLRLDEVEIQKVLLNLLVNAREAGANVDGPRVEVGQADGMAFVQVADSGCGMSSEFIRDRLFHPFETTKKKGFGIGLYQCRQVVEAHGGRIEVSSEEGKGSVFTVWLPTAEVGTLSAGQV